MAAVQQNPLVDDIINDLYHYHKGAALMQMDTRECKQQVTQGTRNSTLLSSISRLDRKQKRVFTRYRNCTAKLRKTVPNCAIRSSQTCKNKNIVAVKLIRENYENLIPNLLKLHNNTYIIHYTRDPRGILLSRKKSGSLSNGDMRSEAAKLCTRMYEDYLLKNELQKMYPHQIIDLKYEDLAQNPSAVVDWIYNKIGKHYRITIIKNHNFV